MQQLKCTWYKVNNYRVLCLWNQRQNHNPLGFLNPFQGGNSMETSTVMASPDIVKIALTLYKVQQNIYLLDFQRIEGDAFGFMKLCSKIITELKNLSAASRSSTQQQAAATTVTSGTSA